MGKQYMKRLSGWARWMLPWQEAEDVIGDYRDIVGEPPRSGEELLRDLGKPRDAVKALVQPKQYRVWLALFGFMTACILALVSSRMFVPFAFWVVLLRLRINIFFCCFLSALGVIAALVWFHRQGKKAEHLPKAIPILLAVFLAFVAGEVLFYGIAFRNPDVILRIWDETLAAWFPCEGPFVLAGYITSYGCLVIVLIGVYSLIKARTGDRRWAAVYVLAMAAALILRMVLEWAHAMYTSLDEAVYRQFILQWAVAAAGGLIGTGVALC